MPFCPSCAAEYRAEVRVCPACDTALVDDLEPEGSTEDMTDVYVCYSGQLAARVIEMLREARLTPLLRDRTSTAFPTNVGTAGERRIAVPVAQAQRAAEVLRHALADGVLSPEDGEIGD